MGPVFFGAYLVLIARTIIRGGSWQTRWLLWMSLPIILLICVQAILSRAYANWAAPAYVAAIILTAPSLWGHARRVYWIALAVNLAIALALPVASTQTASWTMGDRLVLGRYTDRAATSQRIFDTARDAGLTDIVSAQRDLLADLFHSAKGTEFRIFAVPPQGHVPHYYAQRHPYPPDQSTPVLLAAFAIKPFACPTGAEAAQIAQWQPGPGAYRGKTLTLYRVDPGCWGP